MVHEPSRFSRPSGGRDRRQELIDRLEQGFRRVQESGEFRHYLTVVSRFHQYSVANTMLIWLQRPEATLVAGFKTWLSFRRYVRKGEHGIRIFAPMPYRAKDAMPVDSQAEPNEEEITRLRFRAVSVFDVSQTDGDDLPSPPVSRLQGDDTALWEAFSDVADSQRLSIDRRIGRGEGANGWYNRQAREIWIDPELSPVMAAKTLCHELGHHFAEHADTRQEHETVAESVAFIVLGHFGIDAGDYSFGYLASWTDITTFRAQLACIQAIASNIIQRIEGRSEPNGRNLGAGLPVPHDEGGEIGLETRA